MVKTLIYWIDICCRCTLELPQWGNSNVFQQHIYVTEIKETYLAFLDLHLSISNDIVSTKIYDKRDDFDFEIVNFPFLDGDVTRSTSYGVYISQLIRFARASSYVADFNIRKTS